MAVEAQKFISSRYGLDVAYFVGRYTPAHYGHRLADVLADYLSSRKTWKMVQAARLNQWVVHGEDLDRKGLDELVRQTFRNTARSIFDLYHYINNPSVFHQIIEMDPEAQKFLYRPEFEARGSVVIGLHMSNFDFIGQVAGMVGVKAMFLGLARMTPHYQKQLEMRQEKGVNIVPTTPAVLRKAIKYLQQGGMVVTGADRPDNSLPYRPRFFDHPAALPVHHIFLALQAHVPITVGSVIWKPDGKYHLQFSEPVEMSPHPDKHTEILQNAERILQVAETYIRQDPCQWSMTFPVWPELMSQVPV